MRDGRLTGPELASFGRHMTSCRACSHEVKALDELADAFGAEGRVEALPDELRVARARARLLADFDRALVASGGRATSPWLRRAAAGGAVAGGLVCLVVCFVLAARLRPLTEAAVVGSGAVITPEAETIWSKQVEGDAEKIVLARGALAIHIDHAALRRGRLIVLVPDGELEDIGTTFTVRAADGRTKQVVVQQGSVLVRIRGSAPVLLNAGQTWTAGETGAPAADVATRPAPIEPPADVQRRGPRHQVADRAPPRRAETHVELDEPARSKELRAAVSLLDRGEGCEAAAGFARYVKLYPDDGRAEDAAYLRVIALQRCGSDDEMKRAAGEYLARYPSAFRRAEVERLSR